LVYRFRRGAAGWTLAGTLRPPAGDGAAAFGGALARDGTRLLIGAPGSDGARGRAYLAEQGGDGTWSEPARLALPREPLPEEAGAGSAVLLGGGQAWIGAPGAGRVFVLESRGGG